MIDVKEIRIGNFVYNHYMWFCPVTEIFKNSITIDCGHYGEETYDVSDVYPIPLTQNILKKLQFKPIYVDESCFRYINTIGDDTNSIVIDLTHPKASGIYNTKEKIRYDGPIVYLHELQNLTEVCKLANIINLPSMCIRL